MTHCFILGSLNKIQPTQSTAMVLWEALQARETVWLAEFDRLKLDHSNHVSALGIQLSNHYQTLSDLCHDLHFGPCQKSLFNLAESDHIWIRFNPHLNFRDPKQALLSLQLLDQPSLQSKFVNHPRSLLSYLNKSYLTLISDDFKIPFHIGSDTSHIQEGFESFGNQLILKPLSGHSGENVFLVQKNKLKHISGVLPKNQYFMIQPYCEGTEKRVILSRSQILESDGTQAIYTKQLKASSLNASYSQGGGITLGELNLAETSLIIELQQLLKDSNISWAAIDILDNKLLEINAFCPGGLYPLSQVSPINFSKRLHETMA